MNLVLLQAKKGLLVAHREVPKTRVSLLGSMLICRGIVRRSHRPITLGSSPESSAGMINLISVGFPLNHKEVCLPFSKHRLPKKETPQEIMASPSNMSEFSFLLRIPTRSCERGGTISPHSPAQGHIGCGLFWGWYRVRVDFNRPKGCPKESLTKPPLGSFGRLGVTQDPPKIGG